MGPVGLEMGLEGPVCQKVGGGATDKRSFLWRLLVPLDQVFGRWASADVTISRLQEGGRLSLLSQHCLSSLPDRSRRAPRPAPPAPRQRLSCIVACGIFQPQGSNLCLLHWQLDSLLLRKSRHIPDTQV